MPAIAITPPMARPIHSALSLGSASCVAASPRRSARGSVSSTSVTPGICTTPPTIDSTASGAIADLHRPLALGDVVLGAGEADVGVLGLAGRRVGVLAVVEVAVARARAPPGTGSP